MQSLVLSAFCWALVAVLLIARRARRERYVLFAWITLGVQTIVNSDLVVVAVDNYLGGVGVAHLLAAGLLMLAVFFIGRGIARTGDLDIPFVRFLLSWNVLVAALSALLLSFLTLDRSPPGVAEFGNVHGDQFPMVIFDLIEYLYLGGVLVALCVISVRQVITGPAALRAAAMLLVGGSSFGVVLSLDVLVASLARYFGWEVLWEATSSRFWYLQLGTVGLLALGMAMMPIVMWLFESARGKLTQERLHSLDELWVEATHATASVPIAEGGLDGWTVDAEAILHRRIVEIRDAAIDRTNPFRLTEESRNLLLMAEGHLAGL